ncbi:MAG: amidohydrolase family protein [Candidatus Nezhaarchaeota archaeon]|nr:amidohydrolase family protein [Candidatus Nezhaarchaeota archaeon]
MDRVKLAKVALGEVKADLVISGGHLVDVYTGELVESVDVAVKGERIAYVGEDASHTVGPSTEILKADGLYVAPGFIDAHTHIDLYCTPAELCKAALSHGTTSIIAEPDELANVLGFEGLRLFVDMVEGLPVKVYMLVPLVCPQDPLFDDNKPLSLSEVEEALGWPVTLGLGEAVRWRSLLEGDPDYELKIAMALRMKKVVEGHSAGARGAKLQGYLSSGVGSCHESITAEEALEKARLGVHVIVREGSLRQDLANVLPGFLKKLKRACWVSLGTDIMDPEDLVKLGYMDYVARRAIELGVDPVEAVAMVTVNPARYFNIEREVGGVAPGRQADLVLLSSLERLLVEATVSRGRLVFKEGRLLVSPRQYKPPLHALDTVKVPRPLEPSDFELKAPREGVKVRVVKLLSESTTKLVVRELPVREGRVELPEGYVEAAVIDRVAGTGRVGLGVLEGFGAEVGGLASTLNFDENNLVVLGKSRRDMALAANRVVELRGGIVVAERGRIVYELAMPLAGVMSLSSLEEVAERLTSINEYLRRRGAVMKKPLNVLLFLTFVTLPEARLCPRGLVDVKQRRLVPLFVEE